jgi:small subunit ribosomal protein S16
MSVKIRLSRHGKKHEAYYHIVVADSRAPRDGSFIEVIGKYNPNTNPATIEINNEKALAWLNKGAQPTDTLRAILGYKGVMFRKHLQRGVEKGLMTQEAADAKYEQFMQAKQSKVEEKRKRVMTDAEKTLAARLAEETKVKEAIAEKVRVKNTPPPVEEAPAAEAETPATTEAAAEPTAEGSADAPAAE